MPRTFTIWLLLLFPLLAVAQASELQQLSNAQYLVQQGPDLPPVSGTWTDVQLPVIGSDLGPEDWQQAQQNGAIWFRLLVQRPSPQPDISLLFWRYNLSMQVWFNRAEIAADGQRDGRLTTAWNRPLLANTHEDQWLPGDNEVLVRLSVTPYGGNLAPVLLGDTSSLRMIQESRQFRQVEVNRILLAFAITMGLFTVGLWAIRRKETVYLWFSGICFAWALATSHNVIYYNPFPYAIWLPLVHAAIDACIFCLYGFIGRLANVRKPILERILLAWTIAAGFLHVLIDPHYFWYSAYIAHLVGLSALLLMVCRVALTAVRQRRAEAIIIAIGILTQIALFILNAFQMFFDGGEGWDSTLAYAHFGIPILLMIFAVVLLRRFTQALEIAESLNRDLEEKVEESRQIIAKSFEERRKLEMQQATEQERQKIYRDLHDDVGSKLLSIIYADADNKLGDMARSTLQSLRRAVAQANSPDQHLEVLLQDIRDESMLRLQDSDHQVDWQLPETLPSVMIPAHKAYNLSRIMRELISNIIHHARASRVSIVVSSDSEQLCITVTDNGCGFTAQSTAGSGLNNIRSRAAEINAEVDWQSTTDGTRTQLVGTLTS